MSVRRSRAGRPGCGSQRRGETPWRALRLASTALLLAACAPDPQPVSQAAFTRNVENCLCRALDFEADNYAQISYASMTRRCNQRIIQSNKRRFANKRQVAIPIDSLWCDESVEEWRESVAETVPPEPPDIEALPPELPLASPEDVKLPVARETAR